MPYVVRDSDGRLSAMFAHPAEGAVSFCQSDTRNAYLSRWWGGGGAEEDLSRLVIEMTTVLEDIIGLFLSRNAVMVTDLSPTSQKYVSQDKCLGTLMDDSLSHQKDIHLPE